MPATSPPNPSGGTAPDNSAVRDTKVRGSIKIGVRLALFAKNAGRCMLCNRQVIGGQRSYLHSINAAELAHIVGATDTEGSPRALDANGETPIADREDEDNLILACHDCHRLIDDEDHVHLYTAEALRELKRRKEERVEMVTSEGIMTQTAVLRVGADVRGKFAIASNREVAEALFAKRFLPLVQSQRSGHFPCALPGTATDEGYWAMARSQIRKSLTQVEQAVTAQEVTHLSVFAIGPIPALVLLGSELDDKIETTLWQKQRDAGWSWPETGEPVSFSYTADNVAADPTDVVLVCSLSGEVNVANLPTHLSAAPRLTLRPDQPPSPTLMVHEKSLDNFKTAFRDMLGEAETLSPGARRWHLVGAVPTTAAIETGRAFMRDSQPPVDVYQLTDDSYEAVLTVNASRDDAPTAGSANERGVRL